MTSAWYSSKKRKQRLLLYLGKEIMDKERVDAEHFRLTAFLNKGLHCGTEGLEAHPRTFLWVDFVSERAQRLFYCLVVHWHFPRIQHRENLGGDVPSNAMNVVRPSLVYDLVHSWTLCYMRAGGHGIRLDKGTGADEHYPTFSVGSFSTSTWASVQPDFLGLGATMGSFCASPPSASAYYPLLLSIRQPNQYCTKLRVLRL